MRTRFKHLANRLRASVLLCGLLATAARAAEPVEWTARPGDGPKAFARHHGSTLEFRCTFTGFGGAFAPDADLRLWYQTNGMGQAWWSVPASRSNDVLSASWPPTADPGADRISFFFGAPSNAYASAVLRMQSSPGFTPNILQPPVLRLDFDGLDVANAPWATPADVSTALLAATNYTDAAIRDYAAGNETDPVWSAEKSSYLPKSGGAVTGETSVAGLAITASPGWPEYRILFGPNSLDGTYIYWDDQSGRFATWRTAYGGYRFAMEDDLAAMAQFATNYVNAATNALTMSTASALGSYLPLSGGMLSGDLAFSGSGAIAYTGVWGVRLYANAGAAGNRIYTNEGDTWQSERGLAWLDETTNHVHAAAVAATNYTDFVIGQFDPPIPVFDVYAEDVTNVSLAVTSSAISTNNQAFVTAVRNVPIAGADPSDLAEIAEYGSYGTVGAAILALIAGLAALKRGKVDGALGSGGWVVTNGQRVYVFASSAMADDESTIARIGDLRYAKHTLTTPAGAATLLDRAVNKYTGDSTFTSCTFTLPPAIDGQVRDFLLDVDNSANASDVAAEFFGLGTDYALAVNADDVSSSKTAGQVLAEMTVVEAGTRARLYITEANQTQVATVGNESVDLPILTVQRMTITPTTVQGGA